MVFVDLPEVGKQVSAGEDCAVAESVKAASDIYSPVSGEILAVNEELEGSPELVNSDPYGAGWLFRIKLDDAGELANLLDAEGYQNVVDEEYAPGPCQHSRAHLYDCHPAAMAVAGKAQPLRLRDALAAFPVCPRRTQNMSGAGIDRLQEHQVLVIRMSCQDLLPGNRK